MLPTIFRTSNVHTKKEVFFLFMQLVSLQNVICNFEKLKDMLLANFIHSFQLNEREGYPIQGICLQPDVIYGENRTVNNTRNSIPYSLQIVVTVRKGFFFYEH